MIPARLQATRFPRKLLQDLGGMSVILRTYKATFDTGLFDDVYVVTDNKIIFDEITNNGGKAIMSIKDHESGSDRIAEAIDDVEADVVINVQGDEPFTNKETLEKLIAVFVVKPHHLMWIFDFAKSVPTSSIVRVDHARCLHDSLPNSFPAHTVSVLPRL